MRIIETEKWSPYPMGRITRWRLQYSAIIDTETVYTYPENDARKTLAMLPKDVANVATLEKRLRKHQPKKSKKR